MSKYNFRNDTTVPVLEECSTGLVIELPEDVVAIMIEIEGDNPVSGAKKALQWLLERVAQAPEWLVKAPRYASVDLLPRL